MTAAFLSLRSSSKMRTLKAGLPELFHPRHINVEFINRSATLHIRVCFTKPGLGGVGDGKGVRMLYLKYSQNINLERGYNRSTAFDVE
jgi:hypothetical protein